MTRRDDEARRGSSEERTTKQKNSASFLCRLIASPLLHHRIAHMSSRALKRLAQAQQLDGHNADDHSDSDEEPAVVAPPKKAFNPFALVCASLRARHAPRSAHSRRALCSSRTTTTTTTTTTTLPRKTPRHHQVLQVALVVRAPRAMSASAGRQSHAAAAAAAARAAPRPPRPTTTRCWTRWCSRVRPSLRRSNRPRYVQRRYCRSKPSTWITRSSSSASLAPRLYAARSLSLSRSRSLNRLLTA